MPVEIPELIVDGGHEGQNGLLESLTTRVYRRNLHFFRNQRRTVKIREVYRATSGDSLWTTQDLTGAQFKVGVGEPDAAPSSGEFGGSYLGSTSGLVDLAHNISAQALENALNANTNITANGGVDVTKQGAAYFTITWRQPGLRELIEWDGPLLSPPSNAVGQISEDGNGSTRAVQTLQLVQKLYAYSGETEWTCDATHATGMLRFDQQALRARFAGTTAPTIQAPMSIERRLPDGEWEIIFQDSVILEKDLITDEVESDPILPSAFRIERISSPGFHKFNASKLTVVLLDFTEIEAEDDPVLIALNNATSGATVLVFLLGPPAEEDGMNWGLGVGADAGSFVGTMLAATSPNFQGFLIAQWHGSEWERAFGYDASGQFYADLGRTALCLGDLASAVAPLLVTLGGTGATSAAGARTNLSVMSSAEVATAIANAVVGLLDLKGDISCSGNPNYPAALKGDAYFVSTAGKIGGGSGTVVSVGDCVIAKADNAGGTQASVGASWTVLEFNIAGITAAGLALLTAANNSAQRTALAIPNHTVTEVVQSSITFSGSAPPILVISREGPVNDGDSIDISVSGWGNVFEFDTDSSFSAIQVDVSGDSGAPGAMAALLSAINGAGLFPGTSNSYTAGDNFGQVVLVGPTPGSSEAFSINTPGGYATYTRDGLDGDAGPIQHDFAALTALISATVTNGVYGTGTSPDLDIDIMALFASGGWYKIGYIPANSAAGVKPLTDYLYNNLAHLLPGANRFSLWLNGSPGGGMTTVSFNLANTLTLTH